MRKVNYKDECEKITLIQKAQIAGEALKEDAILTDERYIVLINQEDIKIAKINEIMQELKQLDIEVPRVLEDIITQGGFTMHQSKQAIIGRKKDLRVELATLG